MSTVTNVSMCELKLNDYYASCVHWQAWIKKQSLFLPCRGPTQTSHVGSCCKLSLLAPHVSCTLKCKKSKKILTTRCTKTQLSHFCLPLCISHQEIQQTSVQINCLGKATSTSPLLSLVLDIELSPTMPLKFVGPNNLVLRYQVQSLYFLLCLLQSPLI